MPLFNPPAAGNASLDLLAAQQIVYATGPGVVAGVNNLVWDGHRFFTGDSARSTDASERVAVELTPPAFAGRQRALRVSPGNLTVVPGGEMPDAEFDFSHSVEFATATLLAAQRTVRIARATYASAIATKTITEAVTLEIDNAPLAGTNVVITDAIALKVSAGKTKLAGQLTVGSLAQATADRPIAFCTTYAGTMGEIRNASTGGFAGFMHYTAGGSVASKVGWANSATATPNVLLLSTEVGNGTFLRHLFLYGAHVSLPHAESVDLTIDTNRTMQFGQNTALAMQRAVLITAPTYASSAATKAITDAAAVGISAVPVAGTNVTIARTMGLFLNPPFAAAAGATKFVGVAIEPTVNQTGTASGDYTALHVNVVETAVLGTNKLLLDLQVGTVSRFNVSNVGFVTVRANQAASALGLFNDNATGDSAVRFHDDTATLRASIGAGGSNTAATLLRSKGFLFHGTDFFFYRGAGNYDGNIDTAGQLTWGASNIFRVNATGQLGFNGSTPVSKGTISGSRGANAALASLLTYLASRGDITDSTSA